MLLTTIVLSLALLGTRVDSITPLILSLEAPRRAAHLSGDADQLANILADDFVDVAATGVRRTKQQNVDESRMHVIRWTSLIAKNEQVQVFDQLRQS